MNPGKAGVRGAGIPVLAMGFSLFGHLACVDADPSATPTPPPNVLLLSIDTLNRFALSAFSPGPEPTPRLDELARRSAVFSHAYTTAPWTLPAQASLLTGTYPNTHGATNMTTPIFGDVPHLAAELQRAGWETVAFTDGVYLDRSYGFDRGFDRYDEALLNPRRSPRIELPREGHTDLTGTTPLFDRALAFLTGRAAQAPPFFLFLQTYRVHDYFKLHPAALRLVDAPPERTGPEILGCLLGRLPCSPQDWAELEALYHAEVQLLDEAVGRLIDALAARGELKNTVIVLLSDHGEGFAPDRGRIHHGGRLHEDLLRVPLLIAGPGIQAASIETAASLIDLTPTLLDLLQLPIPEGVEGVSLVSALRGAHPSRERVLYATDSLYVWRDGIRRRVPGVNARPIIVGVIAGDRWYIGSAGGEELYDMTRDPEQRENLATPGEELDQMRHLLQQRDHRRREPVQQTDREMQPDEDLKERLRSLGYIE